MSLAYDVLIAPMLTEKGTRIAQAHRQYLFRVHPRANKQQIRQAVEEVYKVRVLSVNTQNYLGKAKRLRYRQGWTSDWKRAIITVAEGQTIDWQLPKDKGK